MFINEEPYFLTAPYPKGEAPYAEGRPVAHPIPSRVYCVRASLGMGADGRVDLAEACDVVDRFLAWRPDALFFLRTITRAPMAWLDAHPEEEMRFDEPVTHLPGYAEYRDASVGSAKWLEDLCAAYGDFCRQLHRKYGGRIIGYQFGGGSQGENNPMGSCTNDSRWFCGDFSPAMLRSFRQWLAVKYGSDAALAEAWGDPAATLAQATVPDRVERLRSEWFTFRSPRRAQVADFYRCWAERMEEQVIAVCTAIKEATGQECVAGSHLGAMMDAGLHAYLLHQTSATLFSRAAAHPAVDTFTSPCSYLNKGAGGDCVPMAPVASLQLHGKYRIQDQDTLMSTAFGPHELTREMEMLYFGYYRLPKTVAQSIELLKRDMGHMIIRGYGCWWHPLRPGSYDHPEIVAAITRLNTFAQRSLHVSRGVRASLAVVADNGSAFHQQNANRLFFPMLYYQRMHFWSRTGTGWNLYLHPDLGHEAMPDYPVYLILNLFYLTDEEVTRIEHKVKRSGAIVIWMYAPGIQSPTGFDLRRVERLTGFRLGVAEVEALPRITVTDYTHPFTQGLGAGTQEHGRAFSFGTLNHLGSPEMSTNDEREGMLGPIFYVDDPEATVLGELDCLRKPGFCVKEMEGWTSVYVAAPMLCLPILQNILRHAGVHLYSESGDVFYPGESFLALHAVRGGEKTIRLPQPADVYDLWNDCLVGHQLTEFTAPLSEYATALYYVGDLSAWEHTAD